MDTDIRDALERSFGDGPPVDDLTGLLDRGRRSLRQRRLVEGGSLLLVAGAVVLAAALSSGGTSPSTSPDPAATPTATPMPTPTPTVPDANPDVVTTIEDPSLPTGRPISLIPSGGLAIRPGLEVVRTVAHPYRGSGIETSAAAMYRWRGTTYWYVGFVDAQGEVSSAVQTLREGLTFRGWIRAQGPSPQPSTTDGSEGGPLPGIPDLDLVRFVGDTEELRPLDDVAIFEQRAHPDLPDSFAGPGDRTAVADVFFDGRRYYVLARSSADGGPADYVAVRKKDGDGGLDDFLALARDRYAEGGGGLL